MQFLETIYGTTFESQRIYTLLSYIFSLLLLILITTMYLLITLKNKYRVITLPSMYKLKIWAQNRLELSYKRQTIRQMKKRTLFWIPNKIFFEIESTSLIIFIFIIDSAIYAKKFNKYLAKVKLKKINRFIWLSCKLKFGTNTPFNSLLCVIIYFPATIILRVYKIFFVIYNRLLGKYIKQIPMFIYLYFTRTDKLYIYRRILKWIHRSKRYFFTHFYLGNIFTSFLYLYLHYILIFMYYVINISSFNFIRQFLIWNSWEKCLELHFFVFSTCLVVLIAVPSTVEIYTNYSQNANPEITFKITAHQWYWEYSGWYNTGYLKILNTDLNQARFLASKPKLNFYPSFAETSIDLMTLKINPEFTSNLSYIDRYLLRSKEEMTAYIIRSDIHSIINSTPNLKKSIPSTLFWPETNISFRISYVLSNNLIDEYSRIAAPNPRCRICVQNQVTPENCTVADLYNCLKEAYSKKNLPADYSLKVWKQLAPFLSKVNHFERISVRYNYDGTFVYESLRLQYVDKYSASLKHIVKLRGEDYTQLPDVLKF